MSRHDSEAIAYKLPIDNKAIAAELIAAIPSTWSWCSGQLDAPLTLVADGLSARAGWKLKRWNPEFVTLADELKATSEEERMLILMYRREAIAELVQHHLLPGYIHFDGAGFDQESHGILPFGMIKEIALSHIEIGYSGDLSFYSACVYDRADEWPEMIDLHLAPYNEWFARSEDRTNITAEDIRNAASEQERQLLLSKLHIPRRQHPPLIFLAWKKQYGGSLDHLETIIAACERHDLEELDADDVRWGVSYTRDLSLW